jgi:drug/metabolite transporter (DMT)-like permease
MPRKYLLPCAIACALLWGSAFPGIKFMYREWPESQENWDARLLVAGIRFFIAGLLLVPLAGARGYFTRLALADRGPLWAVAIAQTFGQYILFYTGLALSSAVLGAILISAGSFWWVLLAPVILGSIRPNRQHWISLCIGAIGITIAVYRPGVSSGGSPIAGGLCFLFAALIGTLGIIFHTRLRGSIDTRTATSFSLAAGGIMLAICGSSAWPEMHRLLEPKLFALTLYLAFVSAAAFALWNHLAREFSANILAGYRFLIPISGVLLSILLVPDEKPGIGIFIGGVLVIVALVVGSRAESHQP